MKREVHNLSTGEIKTVDFTAEEEAAAKKDSEEIAKVIYKEKRRNQFASIGDQLDLLYKDLVAGKLDATGDWAKHVKSVKEANPKP